MTIHIRDNIKQLLGSLYNEGYLTHAFVECGHLKSIEPIFRYEVTPPGQKLNTVYDLASLTKALATAPMIMKTFSEDELDHLLKQKFDWLPHTFPNCTIRNLMAHNAGLPPWLNFWIGCLEPNSDPISLKQNSHNVIREVLLRYNNWKEINGIESYSDVGFILAGMILEMERSSTIDALFEDFKDSISCKDQTIGFLTSISRSYEYCKTGFCNIRKRIVQGEAHDENASALGGSAGHAGLFSSGVSLSNYLKCFYNSDFGRYYLLQNDISFKAGKSLFGMRRGDDFSSNSFGYGKAIGHLGFVGTSIWIDMDSSSYGILLCNRTISGRLSKKIRFIRRSVYKLFQELVGDTL